MRRTTLARKSSVSNNSIIGARGGLFSTILIVVAETLELRFGIIIRNTAQPSVKCERPTVIIARYLTLEDESMSGD